ncbi:MAG: fructose-6-phosphate aldolase [Deltaproteobacteria bacterium]|nr:fructose-6-phosphate aldolase [Deltaproteobacteria bacterium]
MKIFIDTANVGEIRKAESLGVLDGVTTNPTLIAKEGRPFRQVLGEICEVVKGPVSAEAVSMAAEALVEEGRQLAAIHENVVVKVPMTTEGLKAVHALAKDGIRTNVTLVFSPTQALLAAKAGATFVSPFVGRLDDQAQDGMELIRQIVTIYRNYAFPTEIIVASVRHPIHVVEAALCGAHVATIPWKVIEAMARHPLTDIGIERFIADWDRYRKQV